MRPKLPSAHPSQRRTGAVAAFAALALLAPAAGAQTMQWFGEWATPNAAEYYVSTSGTIGNPGTLAQPLPTITSALAQAVIDNVLGVEPVTINVLSGTYDPAQNEAFPIVLPAHGVTIEAYTLNGLGLPVVDATPSFPAVPETFLFGALGNPALPASVLRGLEIRNGGNIFDDAVIRIAVPTGAAVQRAAPEIRQCTIIGSARVGVDITSTPGTNLEAVVEGNLILPVATKEGNPDFGVRVTGGDAPTTPLIRANTIQRFDTNVLLTGGDVSHQTRLQSNFIQVGRTNVEILGCAPFVVGNTIAFAFSNNTNPIGITWDNAVVEMTLSNNLIWNPPQAGSMTPIEVASTTFGIFTPNRDCQFNYDGADTLATSVTSFNWGPTTTGPVGPDFVGMDFGAGLTATDIHLNPTSLLRERATNQESQPGGFSSALVPGLPAAIVVRRDHAFDVDFGPRICGLGSDVGADEVTDLETVGPVNSTTRAAVLRARVGSPNGNDIDALGNLSPDAFGNWESDIEVVGTPFDMVLVLSGVGFMDVVFDPAFPLVPIENTSVYQNVLGDGTIVPGMLTSSTVCVDLFNGGSATVGIAQIPASGVLQMTFTFGGLNPAFLEAEAHFQAFAFDSGSGTLIQSTNRLSLDLNE